MVHTLAKQFAAEFEDECALSSAHHARWNGLRGAHASWGDPRVCVCHRVGPSVGPIPLGPIPLGPIPLGPIPLGPIPLGPIPLGPILLGPIPLGPSLCVHFVYSEC